MYFSARVATGNGPQVIDSKALGALGKHWHTLCGATYEVTPQTEGIMSAMRKVLVVEDQEAAVESVDRVLRVVAPVARAAAVPAAERQPSLLRNMALFLIAPFVGLVYALLLPFVGAAMLAWAAGKALYARPKARKALSLGRFVAKLVVAPLVGLAFVLVFPIIGPAMLVWVGVRQVAGGAREHAAA
jgi:hypothetical protein